MAVFNHVAVGTGNAGEAIVQTNGTITLADNQKLLITGVLIAAAGAQNVRIRETNAVGTLRAHINVAAAGTVAVDFSNPIEVVNTTGANLPVVVTQDTAGNANTTTIVGKLVG